MELNYELAKGLKDAGFPQELKDCPICENIYWVDGELKLGAFKDTELTGEEVKSPTLAELVEACGDILYFTLNSSAYGWEASANYGEGKEEVGQGKTSEEAVARLWLALNKKKDE